MDFFIEESCGYCTPCRVGNVLLKQRLEKIIGGRGEPGDLEYLQELGETIRTMSRCGLGQTAANPVLTTLKNFRPIYEALVKDTEEGLQSTFNIKDALGDSMAIAGRSSSIFA
jgi:[NiFe] hydrogenase diaphorase moiety large subunit